ncbi:MAG: hypothetical protein K1X78_02885 [Verrucomicrobiaceae bacterium]|nr:hypothetical protein [Verrucomicrobiaceae bacterium]
MKAFFLTTLLLGPLAMLHAGEVSKVTPVAEPARVELATEQQKLVFTQTNGVFTLSTFVRDDQEWRAMFDAGQPLLEGPLFNLLPSRYAVLEDAHDRKTVEFGGKHRQPDYDWTMRVETTADSPLFRFVITCHLTAPLMLEKPQPVVALWMQQSNIAFHLDQGPDSIYGSAGIPHGYGFPAAYLWDDRREAAVFFNMTPMRWMQPDGVARFHDVRIMTRSESGRTGLGMHFKKLSGRRLPAGEMTVEFFLHQAVRATKPSGMEALDTMMRTFAPLHPADSVFPRNQLTGGAASWDQVARQAMADLSTPSNMAEISAPWHDEPLPLVPAQEKMQVHPSARSWDFSTVNNHLTPWLLLARVHGDAEALQVGLQKADALPRFYDPRARLIRHGTRQPAHVGDLEMSWQNFFFHEEALRAASATGTGDFNPAIAGRFLMATAGLRDLAKNTGDVFPQWFDPYAKQAAVQNDMKQLGLIREPWQAGAYAHLMLQAFDITAGKDYLTEAQRAVETLMERMEFRVQNQIYDREYKDVAEFPITELFGNAYGIAAAQRLFESTRNPKFLRYSRDFMNTLLRLTFWYEDETTPVSRELRNAGLFYPHGGAHVACPWENSEAHLMIVWTLKHDLEHPLTDLLLKLSNLNRINSFYFFPAFWTEPVLALDEKKRPALGSYFPVEPFYSLEGTGGHRGGTAAYMAGLALWNDWLYEALAEASDREIMVLNLDAREDYESALSGIERHFIAYNPTATERTFRLMFKHIPDADHSVTSGSGETNHPAAELRQGLLLTLKPGDHKRLTVRCSDYLERRRQLQQQRTAQSTLAHAYQLMQEGAVARGTAAITPQEIATFTEALATARVGHNADAEAKAKGIILSLQNSKPSGRIETQR